MVREDALKYREVAELLNISQKGIENQMLIAMKRIRSVFEKYTDRPVKNHVSGN
jgi:RNA polymerase sigma-70 factor (ECF subfamily)